MRGSYALTRVTVVRTAVAGSLLLTGAVAAAAGALLPALAPRTPSLLAAAGVFLVGVVCGALHRHGWWRAQAVAAGRAPFSVTVEPTGVTWRRYLRSSAPWVVMSVGLALLVGMGLAVGPAPGAAAAGLGVGLLLSVWRLARWEHAHEVRLWARADAGWLLGRRSKAGPWSSTGPAAGSVRPVVHPVNATRR